jgi:hypothetical protein
MKEKIIEAVAEKAGIDAEKAAAAVDAVLEALKEDPAALKELVGGDAGGGIGDRIAPVAERGKEALGDAREKLAPVAGKGKEALGDAKEKLAPVASEVGEKIGDVGSKVSGRVRGFFKRGKDDDDEEGDEAEKTEETAEPAAPTTGAS